MLQATEGAPLPIILFPCAARRSSREGVHRGPVENYVKNNLRLSKKTNYINTVENYVKTIENDVKKTEQVADNQPGELYVMKSKTNTMRNRVGIEVTKYKNMWN